MTEYEKTELAYKNGYAKGFEDGKPKWIPVTEQLPWKELEKTKSILPYLRSAGVIGYIPGAVFPTEVYFADDGRFYFCEDSDPDIGEDFNPRNALNVSHWMPFPD